MRNHSKWPHQKLFKLIFLSVLGVALIVQGAYYWGDPTKPYSLRFTSEYIYIFGELIGMKQLSTIYFIGAAACFYSLVKRKTR